MTLSPLEAKFVAALGEGKLRIWGGDGDESGDKGKSGDEGASGGEGASEEGEMDPKIAKRIKDAEDKAKKAEDKVKESEKKVRDAEQAQIKKEREGMEDAERTAAERDEYKEKYDKLLKVVETTHIDTAINNMSNKRDKNGQPKYEWHDATAVRAFIDKEAIEVDLDTGEISGLDTQLANIAKDRSYLLISKEEREGGEQGGGQRQSGGYRSRDQRGTGNHPFGGQPRQRTTDRAALGAKYRLPGFAGAGQNKPL